MVYNKNRSHQFCSLLIRPDIETAKSAALPLTVDGVHLNGAAAKALARMIDDLENYGNGT